MTDQKPNCQRLDDLPLLFSPLKLDKLTQDQRIAIANIDAILPQTQCGLCGHHDGCLPYAHGIVTQQEDINLCVPGGQAVTDAIAQICQVDSLPASPSKWPIDPDSQRPIQIRAVIRENECIGCTKCIPACPVDAIIGTAKHSHSIITDLCTGCELCLAPCPVDCIDLLVHNQPIDDQARQASQDHLRKRYHHHLNRVAISMSAGDKPVVSTIESAMVNVLNEQQNQNLNAEQAKNTILAAKLRTQIKKLSKQLATKDDDQLRQKLQDLTQELKVLG